LLIPFSSFLLIKGERKKKERKGRREKEQEEKGRKRKKRKEKKEEKRGKKEEKKKEKRGGKRGKKLGSKGAWQEHPSIGCATYCRKRAV
jgi:hypothetical protein